MYYYVLIMMVTQTYTHMYVLYTIHTYLHIIWVYLLNFLILRSCGAGGGSVGGGGVGGGVVDPHHPVHLSDFLKFVVTMRPASISDRYKPAPTAISHHYPQNLPVIPTQVKICTHCIFHHFPQILPPLFVR